ncbi:MAG: PKD domain-containing protein [Promethearchaeota archaeon]|jgi:PKD repeat protein
MGKFLFEFLKGALLSIIIFVILITIINMIETPSITPISGVNEIVKRVNEGFEFQDQTVGTLISRYWDFGDGSPRSQEKNPKHAYTAPKSYSVILTIIDEKGNKIDSSPLKVKVLPKLMSDFEAQPRNGLLPLTVTFENRSEGKIDSVIWNFGDGNSESLENPIHTYKRRGTFLSKLTVFDEIGSDVHRINITVQEVNTLYQRIKELGQTLNISLGVIDRCIGIDSRSSREQNDLEWLIMNYDPRNLTDTGRKYQGWNKWLQFSTTYPNSPAIQFVNEVAKSFGF